MISRVFLAIGSFGATIIEDGLVLAIMGSAAFAGFWVADKRKSWWQGTIVGLATLAILFAFVSPSLVALGEAACASASDHDACVADDGD